jgi:hypothetical protein
MKKHCIILIVSIFVSLTLYCSKNNPQKQNSNNEISSTPAYTITASSSGVSPTTGDQVTSGATNTDKGISEAKIKDTLQTLNAIKLDKSMFDFSNPDNLKALNKRNKMVSILMKDPSVLKREDVKNTLINLLNNEVKYSRKYYENTHKGLGESYGEYEGELEILVYKYYDKRSLETMVTLLGDTDGFLTTYWKESSQLVLQRIKSSPNDGNILYQIAALGKAQKEKNFTLDPQTIKSFKEFAFSKLKDNEFYIREPAVEALQYITTKNDKEIIKALKTVAKSDPYRYGGRIYNVREKRYDFYIVREAAQRALEYIEKQ